MVSRALLVALLMTPVGAAGVNLVPLSLKMTSVQLEAFDRDFPVFNCGFFNCQSLGAPVSGIDSAMLDWNFSPGASAGFVSVGADSGDIVLRHAGTLSAADPRVGVAGLVLFEFDVPDLGLPTTTIALVPELTFHSPTAGSTSWETHLSLLCELGYISPAGGACSVGYRSAILGTDVELNDFGAFSLVQFFDQAGIGSQAPGARIIDFIAGDTVQFALWVDASASTSDDLSFDHEIRLSAFAISNSVPEPATALLLIAGLAGLTGWRRRLH